MRVAFYSTKPYDKIYFEPLSHEYGIELHFLKCLAMRKPFRWQQGMMRFVFL